MQIVGKEQWRVERIKKAIRIAGSILDMDEAQLAALIHDIQDIQGHLQVFWKHPMSNTQVRAFATAWELCGEKPEDIAHRVFW